MKKRYDYFEEFVKCSEFSVQCAKMLNEILKNFKNCNIEESIKDMHEIEHNADDSKHAMTNYLLKDFLPPIEMEDLMSISQKLDDVTDLIEEILINIDMFNITEIKQNILDFSDLLVQCTEAVNLLLLDFHNFKKSNSIKEKVVELNRLEEVGDKLYYEHMKNLYKTSNDAIEITIWAKFFDCFEDCFDACESVANDVEAVVMKNT